MITQEQLAQREVGHCVSGLVSTLATGNTVSHFAYDLSCLVDQAIELAAPVDDYEEAARQGGFEERYLDGTPHWCHRDTPQSNPYENFFETVADVCDAWAIEPYQWEVYEHWIVSDWLADKLIAHGEKVDKDFAGLCVWARTTTGQAIAMDAVIQDIWKELTNG